MAGCILFLDVLDLLELMDYHSDLLVYNLEYTVMVDYLTVLLASHHILPAVVLYLVYLGHTCLLDFLEYVEYIYLILYKYMLQMLCLLQLRSEERRVVEE